jgi:N-acetylmuramoyl-L-alanine amidase
MLTARDVDVLARTLYGEARGEPWAGVVAVANVVWNRSQRPERFGSGIVGVCLREKQFSCWNHNDPNRIHMMQADTHDPNFLRCLAAAAAVISDQERDNTGGADHYHTIAPPKGAEVWPPAWAKTMTTTAHIGRHVFLKEK